MMMMQQKPTVDVPPWSGRHLPVSGVYPNTDIAMSSLQQYLPLLPTNNNYDDEEVEDEDVDSSSFAVAVAVAAAVVDAYSCDEFRMYEFKVRGCVRGRSHDWTECPYAHPGEKARRRDPRKYHYSGTPCPDFRKGSCKRGDACEYAHGVFECWLHPTRYRTQPCKDGTTCRRRVCFFAHTPDQLRDSSYDGYAMSPTGGGGSPLTELMASMRKLQLGKVKSMPHTAATLSPTWRLIGGGGGDGGGFCSLPSTPISNNSNFNGNRRFGGINGWDLEEEVDVAEERVESGRALRAKLYEKLSKDADVGPDVGWVSELVK